MEVRPPPNRVRRPEQFAEEEATAAGVGVGGAAVTVDAIVGAGLVAVGIAGPAVCVTEGCIVLTAAGEAQADSVNEAMSTSRKRIFFMSCPFIGPLNGRWRFFWYGSDSAEDCQSRWHPSVRRNPSSMRVICPHSSSPQARKYPPTCPGQVCLARCRGQKAELPGDLPPRRRTGWTIRRLRATGPVRACLPERASGPREHCRRAGEGGRMTPIPSFPQIEEQI